MTMTGIHWSVDGRVIPHAVPTRVGQVSYGVCIMQRTCALSLHSETGLSFHYYVMRGKVHIKWNFTHNGVQKCEKCKEYFCVEQSWNPASFVAK